MTSKTCHFSQKSDGKVYIRVNFSGYFVNFLPRFVNFLRHFVNLEITETTINRDFIYKSLQSLHIYSRVQLYILLRYI